MSPTFTPVLSRPGTAEFGRRPIDTSTRSNICALSASARPSPSIRTLMPFLASFMSVTRVLSRILCSVCLEPAREERDEIAIGAGQQPVGHFDDRDLRAERRVDRAQLETDVAAADDQQRLRNLRQVERAGRVHHAIAVDRRGPESSSDREPVAMIACSNVERLACPPPRELDAQRLRVDERRLALDVRDLALLRQLPEAAGQLR